MDRSLLEFIGPADPSSLQDLARATRKFALDYCEQNSGEDPTFDRKVFDGMAKLGLTGASLHADLGGTDLAPLEISAIIFEIAREQLGPAITLSVHLMMSRLIQQFDTENRHHNLLEQLAAGHKLGAFCLTEAMAGSDASAIQTQATKDGSDYLLNGEKIYITNAGLADSYLVFAKTSSGEARDSISAFVVSRDTPGVSFGPHERKMGCTSAPIASVLFQDARIPATSLVGVEGIGYRIALSGLNSGRINIAAAACGLSSKAIQRAVEYASERKQFGETIAQFQGIQFLFADIYSKFRGATLLTRDAAEAVALDPKNQIAASTAKCVATDAAMSITTDAVQVLGGAGYLQDYGVEHLMRDAKMLQIVEGTNQIQRVIIARALSK